ncbi:MAG: hypothetical protein JO015_18300 [Verrucomicrobia bacterium]|nr:hypothetical protein [Verrucomicrobiota bacterium]
MAIEPCAFEGWTRNLRLSNDSVELIITLEIGPRIMSYRPLAGRNIFKVLVDQAGGKQEADWKLRGGHRLWLAPEDYGRENSLTYIIDNDEVEHEILGDHSLRVAHTAKAPHRLRREMRIHLAATGPKVTVEHTLYNAGPEPILGAPWALSVMAAGGFAIVSQPGLGTHPQDYVPNRRLVLWPFTDLSDERFRLGARLLRLYQTNHKPIKFGLQHRDGWAGYVLGDHLFLKTIPFLEGREYPDFGSNFEAFTNWDFLEVESLGPLQPLEPGASAQHAEQWVVFAGVNLPDPQEEEAFLAALEPYTRQLS